MKILAEFSVCSQFLAEWKTAFMVHENGKHINLISFNRINDDAIPTVKGDV